MSDIQTVVLDWGKVLAYPVTGNWFMTPDTAAILGKMNTLRCFLHPLRYKKGFQAAHKEMNKNHLLANVEEEIQQFTGFYLTILESVGIRKGKQALAEALGRDLVLNPGKVALYEDTLEGLSALGKEYRVTLLSDNWPSFMTQLADTGVGRLVEGVVKSCDYGICKNEKTLFEIALAEWQLEPSRTVFVDDAPGNLKVAKEAGLRPVLMDRERVCKEEYQEGYPVVHSLDELQILFKSSPWGAD